MVRAIPYSEAHPHSNIAKRKKAANRSAPIPTKDETRRRAEWLYWFYKHIGSGKPE